ncbi:MAG: MFS transporter [Gammaproteobacteria bacterium]
MNEPKTTKIGPLWFTPGVTGPNVATMLFASFGTIAMMSFMSFIQPYVLTELLNVPEDQQGGLTGNLHAFQEAIFICLAGLVGAFSDRVGRPIVYSIGFIVVAAGYALYPMCQEIYQLYIVRGLFAVGVAMTSIMLSACLVDYIQERSRGRWIGTTSVCNGLGVVTMAALLARLPAMYENAGASSLNAGYYSFWTVAGSCLFIGLVLYLGLFRSPRSPKKAEPLLKQFLEGARAGIANPRLAIVYGGAFIGRGDFAVVGTFFSLWLTQVGIEQGMTSADALKKAGLLFAMIQICALLWAPVMGFISDRVDRMTAVSIGLFLAGAGYLGMSQVPDPFGPMIYPAAVLLGMGETGVIVSVGALLGQESNSPYRGSIVGVFGLFGGLGILVTTLLGGQLFDGIGRTAPFVMMGLMNFVLMAFALYVGSRTSPPQPIESVSSENA